jgi:hypothetical protein
MSSWPQPSLGTAMTVPSLVMRLRARAENVSSPRRSTTSCAASRLSSRRARTRARWHRELEDVGQRAAPGGPRHARGELVVPHAHHVDGQPARPLEAVDVRLGRAQALGLVLEDPHRHAPVGALPHGLVVAPATAGEGEREPGERREQRPCAHPPILAAARTPRKRARVGAATRTPRTVRAEPKDAGQPPRQASAGVGRFLSSQRNPSKDGAR